MVLPAQDAIEFCQYPRSHSDVAAPGESPSIGSTQFVAQESVRPCSKAIARGQMHHETRCRSVDDAHPRPAAQPLEGGNRAISTANGLRSTPGNGLTLAAPAPPVGARAQIAATPAVAGAQRPPSKKWPDPQAGSIIVTRSWPNSRMAGSSVRSRIQDSTKSGVCNSA